jgi:hypothetical protein
MTEPPEDQGSVKLGKCHVEGCIWDADRYGTSVHNCPFTGTITSRPDGTPPLIPPQQITYRRCDCCGFPVPERQLEKDTCQICINLRSTYQYEMTLSENTMGKHLNWCVNLILAHGIVPEVSNE